MNTNYSGNIEVGLDEAGRGSLIGPVFVAGVVFPLNYNNDHINDSKKLSHQQRAKLVNTIENSALDYAITYTDVYEIDKLNIRTAILSGFHKALDSLNINFKHIIIDGTDFETYKNVPYTCIKQGDTAYLAIAAASILAKYYRDQYVINEISPKVPHFNFHKNKGYGTKDHKQKLKEFGPTEFHRKSFKPVKHMY